MGKTAYMIGVCGTGMGQLALLLREAGYEVIGSDVAFAPPVGPELVRHGVRCLDGYRSEHLDLVAPALVVVGNVIRKDNPEALRAQALGLRCVSMSQALREVFLQGRQSLVVAGTHGKTTTSAMLAHLLCAADREPGWFVGGVPKSLPAGAAIGRQKRALPVAGQRQDERAPFVLEGDEYDDVYWSKKPKFLDYVGLSAEDCVLLTSIEQDHIDIYPDLDAYLDAFRALIAKLPESGLLVAYAGDRHVRELAKAARARVVYYALDTDDVGDAVVPWQAALAPIDELGRQHFDLYAGGVSVGRFAMPIAGAHNTRNALGALALCAEALQVPWATLRRALLGYEGVRRRQDLFAAPRGVRLYDDFAHHPTAVDETLRALRRKHPQGKLIAVFEPRSATACRSLHQDEYPRAFASADQVILAPLGRAHIAEAERLDVARVASALGAARAFAAPDTAAIVARVAELAAPGDTVAILSNGTFDGLHQKLAEALAAPR